MNTIPDAAIEAAAHAVTGGRDAFFDLPRYEQAYWRDIARAALEVAMPTIREAIAQEIEAAQPTPPPAVGPWMIGVPYAARIVRGGTP